MEAILVLSEASLKTLGHPNIAIHSLARQTKFASGFPHAR